MRDTKNTQPTSLPACCLPDYLLAYPTDCLKPCLHACQLAGLPAVMHAFKPACVSACMTSTLAACLPDMLPACLQAWQMASLPACSHACLLACRSASRKPCQTACLTNLELVSTPVRGVTLYWDTLVLILPLKQIRQPLL